MTTGQRLEALRALVARVLEDEALLVMQEALLGKSRLREILYTFVSLTKAFVATILK